MVAMVGNDVVDLHDRSVATGPRHPRFDTRVFAPSEHRALRESADANPLRWSFWAAKEAAYKVAKKLDDATVWSPVRFVVRIDASGSGRVEHEGREFPVQVETDAERVHAVACDAAEALSKVRVRVAPLPAPDANPSAAVRDLAREDLAGVLGKRVEQLEIARRGRIPVLRVAGEDAPLDLSLSHHGRFVAWATEPIACRSRA
ncbi:MAG: 4'-phosphopantetheinyl transferase superfamily protein [Myxococcota bacterium]